MKFDNPASLTDVPVQMPLFNSQTAVEAGRRSQQRQRERREQRRLAERQTVQVLAPAEDERRKARTLKQLDQLDDMLESAQRRKDAELVIRLTAAKERLWKLVTPTAGVLRPRGSTRPKPPTATELPPVPTPQTPQAS
ncbi:MAG: hypothetical protein ABSB84_15085 [Verrucomicrobiota bacterium]